MTPAGPGRPDRPGDAVELDAPAKVNLFLHVGPPGPDGYHPIETLFQSLELADRVRVALVSGDEISLDVSGLDAGPAQGNLVLRAAAAFLDAAEVRSGVELRLEKRIPAGGGLGGGSSDAAATLRALDALLPGLSPERLLEVALGLGSDVPFFLCGSALAIGAGRGERLTPLAPLPAADVVLALPDASVSTAWAYRALDAQRGGSSAGEPAGASQRSAGDSAPRGGAAGLVDATQRAAALVDPGHQPSWATVAKLAGNDFEDVVLESHPLIGGAFEALRATRPLLTLLAGSGSSVFAVYGASEDARRALAMLPRVSGVRFVHTRTRTTVAELVGGLRAT